MAFALIAMHMRLSAQTPVGANMSNPVVVGTLAPGVPYSDTKNNSTANGYGNDIGQPSDDIYYKFTIANTAVVSMSHCGSPIDTYMWLLSSTGTVMASNDDNGPLCTGIQASIQQQLAPGTYFVVSEGWNYTSGNITTTLSIPADTTGDFPNDFSTRIKSIFQNVNLTSVTTGILSDLGADFAGIDNFDGTAMLDSNYTSPYVWRGLYASLITSQATAQASFTDFPTLNTRINNYLGGTRPVPMLLLRYYYHALRADAVSSNLMYVNNGQLFDTPGRTQSPYVQKNMFAAAPAVNSYRTPDGYVSFLFPSDLIFNNTGKTITSLKMDAGDGSGMKVYTVGSAQSIHYTTGGEKTLQYQVTFSDNSVSIGHSSIYIDYRAALPSSPGGGSIMQEFHGDLPVTITASTPYGVKKAFLNFAYSNQHADNVIRKPLLVVEGFDPWRIVAPNDSVQYNYSIESFLTQMTSNVLDINNQQSFLYKQLDLLGYDIIFVDFQDGTDYLEDNSALVQAAITWVNGHNQGGTQLVVLGQSMGAVVARHALRQMELHSIAHNTRLFISMDGPHQGANFPLSLQAMIKHVSTANFSLWWNTVQVFKLIDMYPGLNTAVQVLNAPASKELLTYRIGDGVTLPIDNAAHDNFFSAYYSMGMPVNCHSVAISGGSECGTGQPYGPYALLFKQYSNDKTGLGAWMNVIDLFTAVFQVPLGLTTNRPLIGFGSIFGVLSFKTSILINFQANALPDHSSQQIYKGQVAIQRKILGLINVNSNITNRSVKSNSSMLPLDSAPGGQTNFTSGSSVGILTGFTGLSQAAACYIPTVSALNIGGGTTVINTAQLNAAYSISNPPASPYNSTFARFVTAVKAGTFVQQLNNQPPLFVTMFNEDHFTYTPRNGDFILRELRNDYSTLPNCSVACNTPYTISGPAIFCNTGTYTLSNVPAGATVGWSVTGNATGSSTNGTIVLTANGAGTAALNAIIYSNCSFNSVPVLNVVVGLQILSGSDYVDRTPQQSKYVYLTSTVPLLVGTTTSNYTWYQEVNNVKGPQIGSGLQLTNYPIAPASVLYFRCEAITPCGTAIYRSYAYNTNSPNALTASFTIYPNPAQSDVSILATNTSTDQTTTTTTADTPVADKDRIFDAYLINDKGIKLRSAADNKNVVHFSIGDIPNGLYFIHIHENGVVTKKELLINR